VPLTFFPIVMVIGTGLGCEDLGWLNPGPTESWSRSDSKV
jgi:hypothetical protein